VLSQKVFHPDSNIKPKESLFLLITVRVLTFMDTVEVALAEPTNNDEIMTRKTSETTQTLIILRDPRILLDQDPARMDRSVIFLSMGDLNIVYISLCSRFKAAKAMSSDIRLLDNYSLVICQLR
jgi:hypothetical protein